MKKLLLVLLTLFIVCSFSAYQVAARTNKDSVLLESNLTEKSLLLEDKSEQQPASKETENHEGDASQSQNLPLENEEEESEKETISSENKEAVEELEVLQTINFGALEISALNSLTISQNGIYTYEYNYPTNVDKIQLTFSANTHLEDASHINIFISNYNTEGANLQNYYGGYFKDQLAGSTLILPSSSFRLEFEKRDVNNASTFNITTITESTLEYGFKIENEEVTITSYSGDISKQSMNIPNEINGYPVTKISEQAFAFGKCPTKVYIPSSIKVIEANAFFWNFAIKEVHIESFESWFNIDFKSEYSNPCANNQNDLEFYLGEEKVTNITVPTKTLKNYSLYQIIIQRLDLSNVEVIENNAIIGCVIKNLVLGGNIQNMGSSAKNECYYLIGKSRIESIQPDYTLVNNLENKVENPWFLSKTIYCFDLDNLVRNFLGTKDMSIYEGLTIYSYRGSGIEVWHEYNIEITETEIIFTCKNCGKECRYNIGEI